MTQPIEPPPERAGRRRGPLVLAAVATGAVLVAGAVVVWDRFAHDDYTGLPDDCAELLPGDLADRLPGTEEFELRGGLSEVEEDGVLQLVHCESASVIDGAPVDFSLQALLYDPDDRESIRRMQAMVAEGQMERESEDFEMEYADPPMRAVEWRSLPVGDGGYATASQPVSDDEENAEELWASLEYSVANVRVSLFHQSRGSVDPVESLEALEGVAEDLVLRPRG